MKRRSRSLVSSQDQACLLHGTEPLEARRQPVGAERQEAEPVESCFIADTFAHEAGLDVVYGNRYTGERAFGFVGDSAFDLAVRGCRLSPRGHCPKEDDCDEGSSIRAS